MPPTRISIITVVLNDVQGFIKTAESILAQSYDCIEWIVIDGGSDTEFLMTVDTYRDRMAYFISEKDDGIYDAMNKGLDVATGDWTVFLNAGDTFFEHNTISQIISALRPGVDIVYGDGIADYHAFKVYQRAGLPDDLWKGMICQHQSVIFRIDILKSLRYDLTYRISADYKLILQAFQMAAGNIYLPTPISVYVTGGISNRRMIEAISNHFAVLKESRRTTWREKAYYYRKLAFVSAIMFAHRVLPGRFMLSVIRRVNKRNLVSVSG